MCLGCCRTDACVPWYVPVVDAVPSVSLEDSCVGGIAVLTESSGGGGSNKLVPVILLGVSGLELALSRVVL